MYKSGTSDYPRRPSPSTGHVVVQRPQEQHRADAAAELGSVEQGAARREVQMSSRRCSATCGGALTR
jgi:hypothetical protein